MYDLLSPLEWIGIFFSRNLMSVHDPAKFQQYSVIFAKSAADTKKTHVFPGPRTFYGRHCIGSTIIHCYLPLFQFVPRTRRDGSKRKAACLLL